MPFDGCNMLIALRHPARTQNRCRPRWNDDVSLRMPISALSRSGDHDVPWWLRGGRLSQCPISVSYLNTDRPPGRGTWLSSIDSRQVLGLIGQRYGSLE
jgi:hypothetical protein